MAEVGFNRERSKNEKILSRCVCAIIGFLAPSCEISTLYACTQFMAKRIANDVRYVQPKYSKEVIKVQVL